MQILTKSAAGECVITLAGNMLSRQDVIELQQALERCIEQGQRVFRFDMANVGTVETAGVTAFVSVLDRAREHNATISLAPVPEHLQDLIASVNTGSRPVEAGVTADDTLNAGNTENTGDTIARESADSTGDTATIPDSLSTVQPPQESGEMMSWTSSTTIEMTSTDAQIAGGARKLAAFLERLDIDSRTAFAVRVAFIEAVGNAIRHGNNADASKCVVARCMANDKLVKLSVSDEGSGFDCARAMESLADPLRDRSRGLHLMNLLMDEVSYNQTGNVVSMVKSRTIAAAPDEHGGNKHGEVIEQAYETAV